MTYRRIFISVGMSGRSEEEVYKDLDRAMTNIKEMFGECFTRIEHNWKCKDPEPETRRHGSVWYLGKALETLSRSTHCYFVKGWQNYKGCRIEMEVCKEYGIEIIEEA